MSLKNNKSLQSHMEFFFLSQITSPTIAVCVGIFFSHLLEPHCILIWPWVYFLLIWLIFAECILKSSKQILIKANNLNKLSTITHTRSTVRLKSTNKKEVPEEQWVYLIRSAQMTQTMSHHQYCKTWQVSLWFFQNKIPGSSNEETNHSCNLRWSGAYSLITAV